MRKRSTLVMCIVLATIAAGCPAPKQTVKLGLPLLLLESPVQNSTTSQMAAVLEGRSDADAVKVNGERYQVDEQKFRAHVNLGPGQNAFLVEAGNGFSTTSLTVLIERVNP